MHKTRSKLLKCIIIILGAVPIRREIRSLQRDFPDLWTLYILGLKTFQEADENDLLSYYRIAGIHGRPYRPWNDVTGQGPQRSGYCTHASILFPTWHRPYLALFEVKLQFPPSFLLRLPMKDVDLVIAAGDSVSGHPKEGDRVSSSRRPRSICCCCKGLPYALLGLGHRRAAWNELIPLLTIVQDH